MMQREEDRMKRDTLETPVKQFVLAILAASLVSCSAVAADPATPPATGVAAGTTPAGAPIVAESALLRVIEDISVPARAAGVLATTEVREGDLVEAGQLLARVDNEKAKLLSQRAQLEFDLARHRAGNSVKVRSAEKALDFARHEHQRFVHASEELPGSVSRSELEESEMRVDQATLELEQARHDRRADELTESLKAAEQAVAVHEQTMHEIAAPTSGMVVEILRRRGEWVEPGEDVMRIMRLDRLRAEGLVAVEQAVADIVGAEVAIRVPVAGRPPIETRGKVVFLHPEINPVNGRRRVRAEFDNPDGKLMPGMRAEMKIFVGGDAPNPPAAGAATPP